jgi:hypothetical protein
MATRAVNRWIKRGSQKGKHDYHAKVEGQNGHRILRRQCSKGQEAKFQQKALSRDISWHSIFFFPLNVMSKDSSCWTVAAHQATASLFVDSSLGKISLHSFRTVIYIIPCRRLKRGEFSRAFIQVGLASNNDSVSNNDLA